MIRIIRSIHQKERNNKIVLLLILLRILLQSGQYQNYGSKVNLSLIYLHINIIIIFFHKELLQSDNEISESEAETDITNGYLIHSVDVTFSFI